MSKKSPEVEVPAEKPTEEKKSDTERILDTLLKISEKTIAIEKIVADIQVKQRAGRF